MRVFIFNIRVSTVLLLLIMEAAVSASLDIRWEGIDGDNKAGGFTIAEQDNRHTFTFTWQDYVIQLPDCQPSLGKCSGQLIYSYEEHKVNAEIRIDFSVLSAQLSGKNWHMSWQDEHIKASFDFTAGIDQDSEGFLASQVNRFIKQDWSVFGQMSIDGKIDSKVLVTTDQLSIYLGENDAVDSVDAEFSLTYNDGKTSITGEVSSVELLTGDVYIPPIKVPLIFSLDHEVISQVDSQIHHSRWAARLKDQDDAFLIKASSLNGLMNIDVNADLTRCAPRYLFDTFETKGRKLESMSGNIKSTFQLDSKGLRKIDVDVKDLSVITEEGLGVSLLNTQISWPESQQQNVRWQSIRIYDILLNTGQLDLVVNNGLIELHEKAELNLWDGSLFLHELSWLPGADVTASVELSDMDLSLLAESFEWPELEGRLNGVIPSIHYKKGGLETDSNLVFKLFDGDIIVDNLKGERLSGVAPVITADIQLDQLDLQKLTNTLEIGAIQGRLRGHVDNLRMVNWQPVQFDASLSTIGSKKRVISARALNSLSEVGGGPTGAMSRGFLGMFKRFSYAELHFACRLQNQVCYLSGPKAAGGGIYMVKGAGLPRVDVVAYATQVDWPQVIRQFKEIASGESEVTVGDE